VVQVEVEDIRDHLEHLDLKYKHLNPVTLELMVLVILEDLTQEELDLQQDLQVVAELAV
jgi:hypothetical protein